MVLFRIRSLLVCPYMFILVLLIIGYVSGNLMGGLESWQFGSWIVLFSVVIHVSLPTELKI